MSFGENIDELVEKSTNGLHSIHHTWKRVRIGEIASLVNGFAFKSSRFNDKDGTPIVRIRDVTKGQPGTFYRGSVDDPKMTFIEDGQIAIGMDGDFNCRIWRGGRALLNQRVCTLEADEKSYLQEFLAFALPGYLKLINDHTSSITVKHLSSRTVQGIPLPLAPLNEQRRIVDKIETLFARLDKGEEALRATQKLLSRYRQSVLKAAVTGELTADWRAENAHRLEHGRDLLDRILQTRRDTWQGRGKYKEPVAPDTTDLPDLPDGWVWATLDCLADHTLNSIVDGPFGSKLKTEHYQPNGVRVLRLENIGDGRFIDKRSYISKEHADTLLRHSVHAGDVVIASLGKNLPRATIVPKTIDCAIVKADCIRFSPLRSSVSARFISTWLNSWILREHVNKMIRGVGRPRLNLGDIRSFPVPLPNKSEQDQIVMLIEKIEGWCQLAEEIYESELSRSTSLRQSILKDAFAGRLVPQDPDDEPASELLARIDRAYEDTPKKTRRKAKI